LFSFSRSQSAKTIGRRCTAAIRIFSERQLPDARWLRERVRAAWELRAPLRDAGCTAYRWLFGEGDGLPGLTVDRYADFAVA
jgi:23S rRNA (cytosine1962-C5)-methyltransferase